MEDRINNSNSNSGKMRIINSNAINNSTKINAKLNLKRKLLLKKGTSGLCDR